MVNRRCSSGMIHWESLAAGNLLSTWHQHDCHRGNISSVKELLIYGINWIGTRTVCASSLNSFKQHLQKLYQDGSFHELLLSVWLKRLSQFPLGRPRLVSYLVSYVTIVTMCTRRPTNWLVRNKRKTTDANREGLWQPTPINQCINSYWRCLETRCSYATAWPSQ